MQSSILSSFLLLFSIVIFSFQIQRIDAGLYKNCPSPSGSWQSIEVSGCSDSDQICQLKKGSNVTMDMIFTSKVATPSVKVKISGILGGIPVPFPVNPNEACGNYGLVCPLKPEQSSHFHLVLPIKNEYPTLPVTINLNLVDNKKKKIACLKFASKIVA